MSDILIRRAQSHADDIARIAPLFDAYRQFYGQSGDLALAAQFIGARLLADESILLLAELGSGDEAKTIGFAQLYRTFSSIAATRVWILNDLYVAPAARRLGAARALMNAAHALAIRSDVQRITLETAADNSAAQQLYESLGYMAATETFRTYVLTIRKPGE